MVFGSTTPELRKMAEWLKQWKVQWVAMESTGVYWIPPYEVLESQGVEVLLTDTRPLSRVPGRKTDMLDCQWIQCLHSHGLLKGCFRPRGIDRGIAIGGAWQSRVSGRSSGLEEADAEVFGPDECPRASGGVAAGWGDGDEARAGDREGRKGSSAIGKIAGTRMPQKRGSHRPATERTLATCFAPPRCRWRRPPTA